MESNLDLTKQVNAFISSLPSEIFTDIEKEYYINDFSDDVLPIDLYENTRQNIKRIADQINKAYHYEIYDGCAVLMRRLLEMLLILSFKANNIDEEIRDSNGNYYSLSEIISKSVSNRKLDLTKNARDYLSIFREKGNLSAHNPFYNARKKDIEINQHKFRLLIEELFYKSDILK